MVICGSRSKANWSDILPFRNKHVFFSFRYFGSLLVRLLFAQRNGSFQGRGRHYFKTPSTADVLILELVAVCCFCVSGPNSLPSPSAAAHIERSHVVQVSSLVPFFTRPFVPRSPFGRHAVRQRGYGLRLLIFKMANNKVDLGRIRSEEIV